MSLKKVYYGVFAEVKCLNDYNGIVLNMLTSLIERACREKMRRPILSVKKIKQLSSLCV